MNELKDLAKRLTQHSRQLQELIDEEYVDGIYNQLLLMNHLLTEIKDVSDDIFEETW